MVNRLGESASPYLLQHKDNPVDWYEWGSEAFEAAGVRDVPVLLSIGYSACHWCHVMAHESFEDPDTAALMNERFVNIKVDREERPDVDSIYMEATQAMSGHGGWPMTVFLTPERAPFYAGTYYPPTDRHGMPSFKRVLLAMSEAWKQDRTEVLGQAERLTEAIRHTIPSVDGFDIDQLLRSAYGSLVESHDPRDGGFGRAPKFPQQPVLEFLMRIGYEDWAPRALEMVKTTLTKMANGGINDHLGGGFSRYSVDNEWLVPHFEKMLYDNAQLARIYLWAGIELEDQRFVDVAHQTLTYLATDLRHPDGGFYSAEDADSEGVEGKFYVWTLDELRSSLDDAGFALAKVVYGVTDQGNFEGKNILTFDPSRVEPGLEAIRTTLLNQRTQRIRPGLDDKIIAGWNGLAIRAFAEAGAALSDPSYVSQAVAAAHFAVDHLGAPSQLIRSWRAGQGSVAGFLEDHAALALGMFALYSATADIRWYDTGYALVQEAIDRFSDPEGGFFDTHQDAFDLIKRPKSHTDNPSPSGNALMAEALFVVGALEGDAQLTGSARATLRAGGLLLERYPSMVGHHLSVLYSMQRQQELAIVGPDWQALADSYWKSFRPHTVLAPSPIPTERPALLGSRSPETTSAYLCRNHVCDLPVTTVKGLTRLLDN